MASQLSGADSTIVTFYKSEILFVHFNQNTFDCQAKVQDGGKVSCDKHSISNQAVPNTFSSTSSVCAYMYV